MKKTMAAILVLTTVTSFAQSQKRDYRNGASQTNEIAIEENTEKRSATSIADGLFVGKKWVLALRWKWISRFLESHLVAR